MEKVLVTGATGFIGLHCIHQLIEKGYSVHGTLRSNLESGKLDLHLIKPIYLMQTLVYMSVIC